MSSDEQNPPEPSNPLEPSAARDQRIRERAYHLWEADGRPVGRHEDYWERARELEAIASSAGAALLPVDQVIRPDEAELQDNLGEFPDRLADQGEQRPTPMLRSQVSRS